MDLATITRADFDAHRGTTFQMRLDATRTVALELISTQSLPTRAGATRDAFLVRFRAAENRPLPQRTYELEHPALGAAEVFLVPSGPDTYDAVFS